MSRLKLKERETLTTKKEELLSLLLLLSSAFLFLHQTHRHGPDAEVHADGALERLVKHVGVGGAVGDRSGGSGGSSGGGSIRRRGCRRVGRDGDRGLGLDVACFGVVFICFLNSSVRRRHVRIVTRCKESNRANRGARIEGRERWLLFDGRRFRKQNVGEEERLDDVRRCSSSFGVLVASALSLFFLPVTPRTQRGDRNRISRPKTGSERGAHHDQKQGAKGSMRGLVFHRIDDIKRKKL